MLGQTDIPFGMCILTVNNVTLRWRKVIGLKRPNQVAAGFDQSQIRLKVSRGMNLAKLSLAIFLAVILESESKTFDKCDLARKFLHDYKFPKESIDDWVCLARWESHYNRSEKVENFRRPILKSWNLQLCHWNTECWWEQRFGAVSNFGKMVVRTRIERQGLRHEMWR